jgi:cyclopropane fatty-acyl-phospholipid synthase-like methyltransferase
VFHIVCNYFIKQTNLLAWHWHRYHCFLVRELQLENVDIIVADISTFEMEASYDRIFSIEMFEVRFCGK